MIVHRMTASVHETMHSAVSQYQMFYLGTLKTQSSSETKPFMVPHLCFQDPSLLGRIDLHLAPRHRNDGALSGRKNTKDKSYCCTLHPITSDTSSRPKSESASIAVRENDKERALT